jgi:hypothetical protein
MKETNGLSRSVSFQTAKVSPLVRDKVRIAKGTVFP